MTATPAATAPEVSAGRKFLHVLGVTALFGLLGPLVGGFVTIAGLGIWIGFPSPGDIAMAILAMMLYGLWIAYPMGFVPAVLVGAVIGYMDAYRGGAGFSFAVALGAAMGVGWNMMMGDGSDLQTNVVHILIGFACVAATITCWLATRWRRPA